MKKILGINVTDKEFDYLMCQQSQCKELKIIDGKVVAVDHQATEQELLQNELHELHDWLDNYYDNQVKQYERCKRLGIEFDKDINELDNKAHNYQLRIREINSLLEV